jgi:hypothetical protein
LNILLFNLKYIIPNKPFFTYTNTSNVGPGNYIVFDLLNAISLNNDTFLKLNKIISEFPLPTPGESLFYNSKGPNHNNKEDNIYISCNPTGNSEKEETVSFKKAKNETISLDISKIMSSSYFIYLMYALIFIIILMIISGLIGSLSSGSLKIPSFTKKNNYNSINNQ